MINEELVNLLISKNITISSIESFTGGLAASKIVEIPGSSKTLLGSLVSYSTLVKEDVLKVKKDIIDKYTVVSKECLIEMLKKGKNMFNSDITIAFTGNAGPSSIEDTTLGLCFMGIYYQNKLYLYKKEYKNYSRNEIRNKAVDFIFEEIIKLLK